ncbi:MAG: repair protein [Sporomusa sp.]|jgi:DNA end-binding protein Ku|nr:repair protein [Sporomusa sp.]
MRPIWKGILSFGLVNVPVTLFSAIQKKTISFNQLRRSDHSRIKYKKVASDGVEVEQSEIIRGFEVSPDRYVVIDDGEFEAIAPKASRHIEIAEFVKLQEIDPRHYDSSYYLAPDQGAGKAYKLLLAAMQEADVVGIARFVLRSKEYLAAIRPAGNALTLSTMLFADEILPAERIDSYIPQDVKIAEKEMDMARLFIQSQTAKFEPEKYENEYYKAVMQMIDGKAETSTVTVTEYASGKVLDIMAALQASLDVVQKSKKSRKKVSGA